MARLLEESLKELNTDYIDIYHLHGVRPQDYSSVCDSFVPVMRKAREEGKIRFLGITELFVMDTSHRMLDLALQDDIFDVIMTGYSLLNPSAAKKILPLAKEKNIGILCMFAVRSALSNPQQLKKDIEKILANGQSDPSLFEQENPLEFLTHNGIASSIMDAAYRFCRHTPGIDVVLTGTGNISHLKDNLVSIRGDKLPDDILLKLRAMFANVDCVSGQ
jgi:aryl-alcohol dehydrogenase-like predicted oxidoreductase